MYNYNMLYRMRLKL